MGSKLSLNGKGISSRSKERPDSFAAPASAPRPASNARTGSRMAPVLADPVAPMIPRDMSESGHRDTTLRIRWFGENMLMVAFGHVEDVVVLLE